MGALVTVILRAFFYLLAVSMSIASSFVLVRRLDPSSYGVFQLINRRIAGYVVLPVQLLGFWAYRYEAEKLGGGRCLVQFAAAYAILALALGFAVSQSLGLQASTMLLAALLLALNPLQVAVQTLLSSLRPVRYSITILFHRIVYSSSIIALVYMASRGLEGAFTAALIAITLAILVGYKWVRKQLKDNKNCGKLLGEWAKAIHTPALAHAASTIASLDAIIAYTFWGTEIVAAYFAISIPSALAEEVVVAGLSYLSAYALATRDIATAYRVVKMLTTITTPLLAYIAVHAWWTTLLVNPTYNWAATSVTIITLTRIINILNTGLGTIYGGIQKGGTRTSKKLSKLNMYVLLTHTMYVSTLLLVLQLAKNREEALVVWTLAALATSIANLTLLAKVLEKEGKTVARETRKTITRIIAYTLMALVLAIQLPPRQPETLKFIHILGATIPTLPVYLLMYAAVVYIVDPEAKVLLAKIPQLLQSYYSKFKNRS